MQEGISRLRTGTSGRLSEFLYEDLFLPHSSHEVLFCEHILPSLTQGFESHSTRLDIAGTGDYLTRDFLQSFEANAELVLESIAANAGEATIWSDVDIVFTVDPAPLIARLRLNENDARTTGPVSGLERFARHARHPSANYEM